LGFARRADARASKQAAKGDGRPKLLRCPGAAPGALDAERMKRDDEPVATYLILEHPFDVAE
jgi:hypothetical protein